MSRHGRASWCSCSRPTATPLCASAGFLDEESVRSLSLTCRRFPSPPPPLPVNVAFVNVNSGERLQRRYVPPDHAEQHRACTGVPALRHVRAWKAVALEPISYVAAADTIFGEGHRSAPHVCVVFHRFLFFVVFAPFVAQCRYTHFREVERVRGYRTLPVDATPVSGECLTLSCGKGNKSSTSRMGDIFTSYPPRS